MAITITDFQPKPIFTVERHIETVVVKVFSTLNVPNAKIEFHNKNQATAELFDSNQAHDTIHSDEFDLGTGDNHITHTFGFNLQGSAVGIGAMIAIDVRVVDPQLKPLSDARVISVSIAAH